MASDIKAPNANRPGLPAARRSVRNVTPRSRRNMNRIIATPD